MMEATALHQASATHDHTNDKQYGDPLCGDDSSLIMECMPQLTDFSHTTVYDNSFWDEENDLEEPVDHLDLTETLNDILIAAFPDSDSDSDCSINVVDVDDEDKVEKKHSLLMETSPNSSNLSQVHFFGEDALTVSSPTVPVSLPPTPAPGSTLAHLLQSEHPLSLKSPVATSSSVLLTPASSQDQLEHFLNHDFVPDPTAFDTLPDESPMVYNQSPLIEYSNNNNGNRKRRSNPSESDFNVLHLEDNSVVDIENFPLFNLDDDMNSLLDQFEEESGSFSMNTATSDEVEVEPVIKLEMSTGSTAVPGVSNHPNQSKVQQLTQKSCHNNVVKNSIPQVSPSMTPPLTPPPRQTIPSNPLSLLPSRVAPSPRQEPSSLKMALQSASPINSRHQVKRPVSTVNPDSEVVKLLKAKHPRAPISQTASQAAEQPKLVTVIQSKPAPQAPSQKPSAPRAQAPRPQVQKPRRTIPPPPPKKPAPNTTNVDPATRMRDMLQGVLKEKPHKDKGAAPGISLAPIPFNQPEVLQLVVEGTTSSAAPSSSTSPVQSASNSPVQKRKSVKKISLADYKSRLTTAPSSAPSLPGSAASSRSNSPVMQLPATSLRLVTVAASAAAAPSKSQPAALTAIKAEPATHLPHITIINCPPSETKPVMTIKSEEPEAVSASYYDLISDHDYCSNVPSRVTSATSSRQPSPDTSTPNSTSSQANDDIKEAHPLHPNSVLKNLLLNPDLKQEVIEQTRIDREKSAKNMQTEDERRKSECTEVVDMELASDNEEAIETVGQATSASSTPADDVPVIFSSAQKNPPKWRIIKIDNIPPVKSRTSSPLFNSEMNSRNADSEIDYSKSIRSPVALTSDNEKVTNKIVESNLKVRDETKSCDNKVISKSGRTPKKSKSKHKRIPYDDRKFKDPRVHAEQRSRRHYRRREKSPSPEIQEGAFINKLPSYFTAVASKNKPTGKKPNVVDTSLPVRDRDPSPDRSDPVFDKLPSYFSCYTNSTKYDQESTGAPQTIALSRQPNSDPLGLEADIASQSQDDKQVEIERYETTQPKSPLIPTCEESQLSSTNGELNEAFGKTQEPHIEISAMEEDELYNSALFGDLNSEHDRAFESGPISGSACASRSQSPALVIESRAPSCSQSRNGSRDTSRNVSRNTSRANSPQRKPSPSPHHLVPSVEHDMHRSRHRKTSRRHYRRSYSSDSEYSSSSDSSSSRSRSRSPIRKYDSDSSRSRSRSFSSPYRSQSGSYRSRSQRSRSYRSRSGRSRSRRSRSYRSRSPSSSRERSRDRMRRGYRARRSRSRSLERWRQQGKNRMGDKRQEIEERRIVYVGRIPDGYTRDKLRRTFSKFGKIVDLSIHFREHDDNYGFVTFVDKRCAFNAIESGTKIPGCENFDLCFGGRREFCKNQYEDLDGNKEDEEEFGEMMGGGKDLDFDALLRQAQQKLKPASSSSR